jgi:glycosyl transferase, family 25
VVSFSQDELRGNFDAFQHAALRPRLFKLVQASGLVCYSISPAGARLFKNFCLPIRNFAVYFRALDRAVPNYGLDVMMNAVYVEANAYTCFPPLVVTPNDHATSLSQSASPEG